MHRYGLNQRSIHNEKTHPLGECVYICCWHHPTTTHTLSSGVGGCVCASVQQHIRPNNTHTFHRRHHHTRTHTHERAHVNHRSGQAPGHVCISTSASVRLINVVRCGFVCTLPNGTCKLYGKLVKSIRINCKCVVCAYGQRTGRTHTHTDNGMRQARITTLTVRIPLCKMFLQLNLIELQCNILNAPRAFCRRGDNVRFVSEWTQKIRVR